MLWMPKVECCKRILEITVHSSAALLGVRKYLKLHKTNIELKLRHKFISKQKQLWHVLRLSTLTLWENNHILTIVGLFI